MSKEKRKGSIFDAFRGGGDVTPEQIMESYVNFTENSLVMTTEIKNPIVMSICDTLADLFNYRGELGDEEMKEAGIVLGGFLRWYRINMCAKDRKRSKEGIDGFVAVMMQKLEREKSSKDKLLGEKR